MKALILQTKQKLAQSLVHSTIFFKWILLALTIGLLCGVVGYAFDYAINLATTLRGDHSQLIYLLPLGGLLIAFLYRWSNQTLLLGTNQVFEGVHSGKKVPFVMAPLIFIGSFITHLFGGSAGREGAALQLGGSIAYKLGTVFHLKKEDLPIVILCGMSALFSSLFFTPFASAIFAIEVITVGVIYYSAFVPCVIASFTAYGITSVLGGEKIVFPALQIPSFDLMNIGRVSLLALLCAVFSIIFCLTMHFVQHFFTKHFKNEYIRIFIGGVLIVVLTLLLQTSDYNGTGINLIVLAIGGTAIPYAFLLKTLFTSITIGSGFKGGEIVPLFFIGATFGCVVGNLLGLDPGFGAAIGLISIFCGAVNAPIASIILGLELFGGSGVAFFVIACTISYTLSGPFSLYSSQINKSTRYKIGFPNLNEPKVAKKL